MNTFKRKSLLSAALAMVAAVGLMAAAPEVSQAATPNYSASAPGVMVIPMHISGQYTATTVAVAKWNMPFKCRLIGVGASARASGGTTPTLTVDLKAAGSTLLTAPITVTAATYTEATVGAGAIADEAAMTIDLTIGGTSPTWNDIVIFITVVRT